MEDIFPPTIPTKNSLIYIKVVITSYLGKSGLPFSSKDTLAEKIFQNLKCQTLL